VLYRGPSYWQPGTTLAVRAALGGHPLGGNWFGDTDRVATGTISNTRISVNIDNAAKQMSVYQDDKLVKKLPVSMGKASTPTLVGDDGDHAKGGGHDLRHAQRPQPGNLVRRPRQVRATLTLGGEFIHAAPWSVQDQGVRNVSHGCTNISMGNAAWLFSVTRIGDPVVIRGTEYALDPGNG
jgi:lipoprotein-anchoring transpeptidase ErfK/SrfK